MSRVGKKIIDILVTLQYLLTDKQRTVKGPKR